MSDLSMAQKRSFMEAFLEEEKREERASKKLTRMELVRAQNRTDSAYQNMLKNIERAKTINEKIRENEAAYEATKEDVARLKARLNDDDWRARFCGCCCKAE